MTQRLLVIPAELGAATTTCGWAQRNHLIAFFDGNQFSLILLMTSLAATFSFRFVFATRWLCMRMLRTGRQRRVVRRFAEPGFQLLNLRQQQPNDRLRFRSLPSNQIFRDFQRHGRVIAEIQISGKSICQRRPVQPVNGYDEDGCRGRAKRPDAADFIDLDPASVFTCWPAGSARAMIPSES